MPPVSSGPFGALSLCAQGSPETRSQKGQDRQRELNRYLRFAGAGTQFTITIVAFTLGGIWLDGKLTSLKPPLFTVLGPLLGMGLAMYLLIRSVYGARK